MFFIYTRVTLQFFQVFKQRAMAAGAEHQLALGVPERAVVGIRGHGVGAGVLKGKSHVKAAAEAFLQVRPDAVQEPLEELAVTGQDGQVHPAPPIPVLNVGRGFHQLFLQGGAAFCAVVVKFDEGFG